MIMNFPTLCDINIMRTARVIALAFTRRITGLRGIFI